MTHFYLSCNQLLICQSRERCIHFCTVAGTIGNTVGYYFSSPALTTEEKKKAQKLVLGHKPHGLQRRAEKGRDQASCATGASSHVAPAQPFPRWKGTKATPAALLHPPKTCTALLSRAHIQFTHHCQLFSHCLKISPIHSFPPPFPLPHPLPNLSQCLPLSCPFLTPVLATHPASHRSLLPLLSCCPLLPPQNVLTYKQVKNHIEISITTCSLLYHRPGHT